MQNANAMVKRIKDDPPRNLEVIDDGGMEFLICSQTIHERWYTVNLGTECCECEDRVSICKHLLVVRKLVEEEFTYLKRILFIEESGFVNNLDDVEEDDVVSPPQSPKVNPLSLAIDDIGERDNSLSVIQVEPTEVQAHPHTQVRLEKLKDLYNELGRDYFTTDKMKNIGLKHVENAIKRLNDLKRQLQFAFNPQLVPRRISLPRASSSIASVQANVSRTRFGHGRPWNPKNKDVAGSSGDTNPSQALGISNLICSVIIVMELFKMVMK
jgi:hypothetical protein